MMLTCLAVAQDGALLNEGFEDTAFPPAGWTKTGATNWERSTLSSYVYEGAACAKHGYVHSGNAWLITPQLGLEQNSLLSFYVTGDYPNDAGATQFTIEVSTTDTATASFTPIFTVTCPSEQAQQELVEIDLSAFTGQDVYIAFHIVDDYGTSFFIDNVVVDVLPSCLKPQGVTLDSVSATTATLYWNEVPEASSYIVEYILASASSWDDAVELETDEEYITIEGLSGANIYKVRVKADCGGDVSNYSSVLTVYTECVPLSVFPTTWDFEQNNLGGSSYYPLPLCWSRPEIAQSPFVTFNHNYDGTKSLYFYGGYGDSYVVLPEIDTETTPINTLQVSFDIYFESYYGSVSPLQVGVMTDPDDETTFTVLATVDPDDFSEYNDFEFYECSLAAYEGEGTYIALRMVVGYEYDGIEIDNVTIEQIPGCLRPVALSATNITTESAILNWMSDADEYTLYYKPMGDIAYTAEEGVALGESGYMLADLLPGTTYQWYVESNCEDGSAPASTVSMFTTECMPVPADQLPYTMDFENVPVGLAPNCWPVLDSYEGYYAVYPSVSDNESHSGSKSLQLYPYGYYESTNLIAMPLIDEGINQLRVTFWLAPSYNNSSCGTVKVGYITDINDNNTFVPLRTIDASELDGTDFLKYSVAFNSLVTEDDDLRIAFLCENQFGYSWYIDDVTVEYIPDCSEPDNLVSGNPTSSSVELGWTGVTTEYTLYYRPDTQGSQFDSTVVSLDDNGKYTLENLETFTTYKWYVASTCDDGETYVSNVASFTTVCEAIAEIPQTWTFLANNTGGTTTNPLPECWIRPTGICPYVTAYSGYGDTCSLYWSYDNTGLAALPPVDVEANPMNTLQVSFFARKSYSNAAILDIGVMTDPTNVSTFESVSSVNLTTSFQEYTVILSGYAGEGKFIALNATTNDDNAIYLDSLVVLIIPDCSKPSNLSASVTATSAVLSWESTAENFLFFHKEASESSYTSEEVELDENGTYTFGPLSPNTTYNWYVSSLCDGDTLQTGESPSFTTLCEMIAAEELPYVMDFEGLEQYSMPSCWQRLESYAGYYGNYPYVYTSSYSSHGGQNYLSFYPYGVNRNVVALPQVNDEIHNLRVNFWLKPGGTSASYGRFEVGLMSDISNVSTFELVKTINATDFSSSTYENFKVSFSGTEIEGNESFIVFRCINTQGYSWYLDDVTIEYTPECIEPDNLAVVSTGQDNAVISWDGETETYSLYYKKASETDYTSISDVALDEDGTYTLSDLEPGEAYEWYVTAVCVSGESAPSNASSLVTECVMITSVPQIWDFEGDNFGGTEDYPLPSCWKRIENPSAYSAYPFVYDGILSFYLTYASTYAILPRVDVEQLPLNTLQLNMIASLSYGGYQNNKLEVGVMTNPNDQSTFTLVKTFEFTQSVQEYEVSFEDYEGEGSYIAIRTRTQSAYNYDYVDIEEIVLNPIPDCDPVDGLEVSGITQTTVDVSWNGENEAGFMVEYKLQNDVDWSLAGTTTENTLTITGLQSASKYSVRVAPVCDGSVVYRSANVRTLCDVFVEFPYKESFEDEDFSCWSSEIVASTENWIIQGDTYAASPSDGSQQAFFTYSPGASARLVSPQFDLSSLTNPTLSYDVYLPAYTSFSGNVYDTVGVYYKSSLSDDWTYITSHTDDNGVEDYSTFTFTLPNPSATYQIMFLAEGFDGYGVYLDNVNIFDSISGETEECVVPTALAVSDQTQTTANVTWAAGGTETSWKLQYKLASENGWVNPEVTVNATPAYTITGLVAGTDYEVRVKAVCGDGNESDWTTSVAFTTLNEVQEPCNAPTNITVTDFGKNSITITWDANGASKWAAQYRKQGSTAWTMGSNNITETTYTFSGLEEATFYEYQVQAVCDGTTSAWSQTGSHSTGIDSRLMNSVSLYPNPATNHVDVLVSDNSVNVSRLEVYDVYGKLLNEVEVVDNPTRIDVSSLAGGVYFVKVITGEGVATKTFVKK